MDRQSLAGFFDELDKIGQFGGDIDDLYAAPNSSIVPTLKRVHNIGKMKGSSWADIGPVGQREGREIPYPRMSWEKKAYQLQGHDEVQGLRVAIENRKGSVRKGTDSNGDEWRTKMKHPYGYLVGTKGADGEPVDCYVGPDKEAPAAFVVHQHKDDGKGYDEDKILFGFPNRATAIKAYLRHYDDEKFLGPVSTVRVDRLRELLKKKKKQRLVKIDAKMVNDAAASPQSRRT